MNIKRKNQTLYCKAKNSCNIKNKKKTKKTGLLLAKEAQFIIWIKTQ